MESTYLFRFEEKQSSNQNEIMNDLFLENTQKCFCLWLFFIHHSYMYIFHFDWKDRYVTGNVQVDWPSDCWRMLLFTFPFQQWMYIKKVSWLPMQKYNNYFDNCEN